MDIQAYISSGILELYLTGQLDEAAAREVESMAKAHPEIQQELDALEESIGLFAQKRYEEKPSTGLLDKIMEQVEGSGDEDAAAPILPLKTDQANTSSTSWRWIAIAAGFTLLLSLIGNLLQYQSGQEMQSELFSLRTQNGTFTDLYEQARQDLDRFQDSSAQLIRLKGRNLFPEAKAMVVWNPNSQEIYFQLARLPRPSELQQYQLWAIGEDGPVDAGLLTMDSQLQAGKKLAGEFSAFAVTLEPTGGSQNPTLEKMVLYGEVCS